MSANYPIHEKALARWAAEKLTLDIQPDGTVEAHFEVQGSTCTNTGTPLAYAHYMRLSPGADKYCILELACAPLPGDTGHQAMCTHDPDSSSPPPEPPPELLGKPLASILFWRPDMNVAGCYCTDDHRNHKWRNALITLHYALAQRAQ